MFIEISASCFSFFFKRFGHFSYFYSIWYQFESLFRKIQFTGRHFEFCQLDCIFTSQSLSGILKKKTTKKTSKSVRPYFLQSSYIAGILEEMCHCIDFRHYTDTRACNQDVLVPILEVKDSLAPPTGTGQPDVYTFSMMCFHGFCS